MSNGLLYSAIYNPFTNALSLVDRSGNILCSFTVPTAQPVSDDSTKPLQFVAMSANSSVSLSENGTTGSSFETSTDGGNTWSAYTFGTSIQLANEADSVMFRCSQLGSQSSSNYVQFSMTGSVAAYNNANSMLSSSFASLMQVGSYGMYRLFYGCAALTRPPLLPCTSLGTYSYMSLFEGCTGLVESPVLPASNAGSTGCYNRLFYGCSSLSKITCMAENAMVTVSGTVDDRRYSYSYTADWVTGVSASGDFYYPLTYISWGDQWQPQSSNPGTLSGAYGGIPAGWSSHDLNS